MSNLNPDQAQAVNHVSGPALVIAGAGAGKTRVVTMRIAELLKKGISPEKILAVTFTNKAAQEMKERVDLLCQEWILVTTFHSLGAMLLRESIESLGYDSRFTIYDEEDCQKLLKSCIEEAGLDLKTYKPKQVKYLISGAKNRLKGEKEAKNDPILSSELDGHFPAIYTRYQKHLRTSNALDFDDLIYLPVKLFQDHKEILKEYQERWSHLLIDEYQDINEAQYLIAHLLTARHKNIFAVGDPDQSIYSWRGANLNNILNFEKDHAGATLIRLEQNFRSTKRILRAANHVIKNNTERYDKELWSDGIEGNLPKILRLPTDGHEAKEISRLIKSHLEQDGIPLNEIVIFYRTNAQSRLFEDALIREGLPYIIIGGISFYQRREIKDLLAYLRVVQSDADYISFSRTINLPKRGIGQTTLSKLWQGALDANEPILRYCTHATGLGKKQTSGLQSYLELIDHLRRAQSLSELLSDLIDHSNYLDFLRLDPENYQDRKENIDQLVAKAAEWEQTHPEPSLNAFLEELSLQPNANKESSAGKIHLMTLHNGKGLEFDLTFLAGMEEGLFPHINSQGDLSKIEEERRLCYVGMTRAKKHLYITSSRFRSHWGELQPMRPSRFLDEIPEPCAERISLSSY